MSSREFRFYYFTPLYEQTVSFYRDLLGFEVFHSWDRSETDRGTIFRSPSGQGLIEVESGADVPSIRGGFYIEVDDVTTWYQDLQRRGAAFVKELSSTSYGHRNFKTSDPNGVEVSFFEYSIRPPHARATTDPR